MLKKIGLVVFLYIKAADKILLLLSIIAAGYGIIMTATVSNYFFSTGKILYTQLIVGVFGLLLAILISSFDYRAIARLWKLYVPVILFIIILSFFIGYGPEGSGAKSWINILGVSLQPSEILKLVFILTFSLHLDKVKDELNDALQLVLLCLHGIFPVLLIHFEGDDGTALVFAFMFIGMMFAAGLSWKYLLGCVGAIIVAAPIMWFYVLGEYQKNRILSIINPQLDPQGIGFQQMQGRIFIGSGMLFGKGLDGPFRYVSEIQNDFILAFIGQAFGFVGCMAVVVILLLICLRILLIGRLSKDRLGTFICVGVFTMIAVQSIVNIGMCLSILPVIGITLPFFSSGGSSLISILASIGLVMSVYSNNKTSLFFDKQY